MKVTKILNSHKPSISFEFFPPKSPEAAQNLYQEMKALEQYAPHFVSVTYGAGGSTRELTHDLVLKIIEDTSMVVVPHLTCVAHQTEEIENILTIYQKAGVENILALRGDLPQTKRKHERATDDFPYAKDLVTYIKEFGARTKHEFNIGVAGFPEGHPETPNRLKEMDYFKAKIDAGADYICTQLFFNNDDLYDFRDRCALAGIHVPIIAGVMPLQSKKGMTRMAELAAGARFPAPLQSRVQAVNGDNISEIGEQYAIEQCLDLIKNGINGIHFYTLNKSKLTINVLQTLKEHLS